MPERLTGLIAATFTPMQPDGSLNLDPIESYAEYLHAQGVAGVFVNGTSGEFSSLTVEDRLAASRRWVDAVGKDMAVIVHVGGTCLAECKALAADAEKAGAVAVACLAPFFFRPERVEDLAEFCREVSAAAPSLPLYYYHIPALTGVSFPMAEFLPVAAERIPMLVGAKFTHEALDDYAQCVRMEDGRFNMLFGRDEMLLAALALGARGAVGTTYNFNAPVFGRMLAAFEAGDLSAARAEQLRGTQTIALLHRYGGLSPYKAVMQMLGVDCGPVRLPIRRMSEARCKTLRKDLQTLGLFDWR